MNDDLRTGFPEDTTTNEMRKHNLLTRSGFTLFELLILIAVLAILLAVVALPWLRERSASVKTVPIGSDIVTIYKDGSIAFHNSYGRIILSDVNAFAPAMLGTYRERCPNFVSIQNRISFLREYERFTGRNTNTLIRQVEEFGENCIEPSPTE